MADIFDKCKNFHTAKLLAEKGFYAYFKAIESAQAPEVMIGGRRFIMAGSNNYLGLADDPRMKAAAIEAVTKYGTGSAGSRFLNGNTVAHEELEKKLAAFKKREAALIYATGYQMNVGTVSCLLQKGDVAVVDKLDHASILDGVKFSDGELRRFKHNDIEDLDRILTQAGDRGKLVIVDGVFSMEGDICPLPDIVKVCKKRGARLIVDDAHGTGVLGEHGRGTCEHFGLENGEIDLIVGTCSKTFAAVGGFVVGDKDIIHYIQHNSRSMIFSAALPISCVATISKAIDIIEQEPARRKKLWDMSKKLKSEIEKIGLNTGKTETPIIPVMMGDDLKCFMMWRALFDEGVFTNPVVSPAVPPGHALMRLTLMATHTEDHITRIVKAFDVCASKIGLKREKITA
ncbi:MAG: pyridoxal phosphate-dependent aminotransferase family protein [Elusimicrobia bacterium]|nr:pyridoxal phosphate-dependent aminotransferase family protein [Elusimicrobiota bacterium]